MLYWPLSLLLAGIALMAVLAVKSTSAQALAGDRPDCRCADRDHPGDRRRTFFINFLSNWTLWAVLGILVIGLLIALVARPEGPDSHHHHDL